MTFYEVVLSLIKKEDRNARFSFNLSQLKSQKHKNLPKCTECKTDNLQVYTKYFKTRIEAEEYINLIEESMQEIEPQVFTTSKG